MNSVQFTAWKYLISAPISWLLDSRVGSALPWKVRIYLQNLKSKVFRLTPESKVFFAQIEARRAEIEAEIELKRAEFKAKTTVKIAARKTENETN